MGEGGAPPIATVTVRASGCAAAWWATPICTVGALHMWVTPSASSSSQMRAGSGARRHTCVPPTAVTAQVKHQPLPWNIGSVHR